MHDYLLDDIKYHIETQRMGLETLCYLTLSYHNSNIRMSRRVNGYWPDDKFIQSHPFIGLLKDALVQLEKEHFGDGSLSKAFTGLPPRSPTLKTLVNKFRSLKPFLGAIEGLGWANFNGKIERVDDNKLCRTDTDAFAFAKTTGYLLDARGHVLSSPKQK